MKFFYTNQHLVTDVRDDILSHVVFFSIPHIYRLVGSVEDDTEREKMLNNFLIYFLPSFVVFLDRFKHVSESNLFFYIGCDLENLQARTSLHHSDRQWSYSYQFRKHLKDHFDVLTSVVTTLYASDWRLSFRLALAFVPKKMAWLPEPNLDDYQHLTLLFACFDIIPFAQKYQHSLAFFSASALHCFIYLSNQATASQGIHVSPNPLFEVPWSWRKRGRNALNDFMSSWTRSPRISMYRVTVPKIGDTSRRNTTTGPRRNDHSLFSQPVVRAAVRSVSKALARRRQALRNIHSKQYQPALFCLILFLPRAGTSAQLLRFCSTQTFSSKSPAVPNFSRKAQQTMNAYVRRWKDYMFVDP